MTQVFVGIIAAASIIAAWCRVRGAPATDSDREESSVTHTAEPRDGAGQTLTAAVTRWTGSVTIVATVARADSVVPDNTATIKGVAAGTVTITAKIAGVSG